MRPKQIAREGATQGQALVWDDALGRWRPGTVTSPPPPAAADDLALATNEATAEATFRVIGGKSIRPDLFVNRTGELRVCGYVTSAALSGTVALHEPGTGTRIAEVTFAGAGDTAVNEETAALPATLALPPGGAVWEVRFKVSGATAPSDRLVVEYAGIRVA